jgi:hypothetical protein
MKRFFVLLLMVVAPAAASAAQGKPEAQQPPAARSPWQVSDDEIRLVSGNIAFPRRAGVTSANRTSEFSRQGEGLDNGLQYQSSDEAVFATVYAYYPGLAHSGLSAVATDQALRSNSNTELTGGDARVVAAGGIEGAAIRRDYGRYRGNLASSAAFIKVDRWLVKLRVSGPAERQAEVFAAMDALLAGVRFSVPAQVRPAAPIAVADCPRGSGNGTARLLPDPVGAEMAAHVFLGTFDGGGPAATENGARRDLPSRVPAEMCMSRRARIGNSTVPILRTTSPAELGIAGQTRLVAFLNDAGGMIEIVYAENLRRHWMLRHGMGETAFLGSYDGVPSDDQILAILSNRNPDESRVRAVVRMTPDGRTQMHLPGDEAARPASPTT